MTDEAKALVERITFLSSVHGEHMHDGDRLTEFCKAGREAVDLIETQAREIERLRAALITSTKCLRETASRVGSMHSYWDVILDNEAILKALGETK